jgi:hypothetical protein
MIGASDSHNTGVPYRQDNFFGGHAHLDGTIEARMAGHLFAGLDTRLENPAGLAGVWAEENTRASLFEAMQRKETFAVSGPHIKLRFFGGWEYKADDLSDKDWVKTGYKKGVPNGRRPEERARQGANFYCLGGEGSDLRKSRPHANHQRLDGERSEFRKDI